MAVDCLLYRFTGQEITSFTADKLSLLGDARLKKKNADLTSCEGSGKNTNTNTGITQALSNHKALVDLNF